MEDLHSALKVAHLVVKYNPVPLRDELKPHLTDAVDYTATAHADNLADEFEPPLEAGDSEVIPDFVEQEDLSAEETAKFFLTHLLFTALETDTLEEELATLEERGDRLAVDVLAEQLEAQSTEVAGIDYQAIAREFQEYFDQALARDEKLARQRLMERVQTIEAKVRTVSSVVADRPRKKFRQDVVKEVFNPAIDTLESNRQKLECGQIGWSGDLEGEIGETRLRPIHIREWNPERTSPVKRKFEDEYGDLWTEFERYNREMGDVEDAANKAAFQAVDVIKEALNEEEVEEEDIELELKPFLQILINQKTEKHLVGSPYREFWLDNQERYREIMESASPDAVSDFRESKQKLLESSNDLIEILEDLRTEFMYSAPEDGV